MGSKPGAVTTPPEIMEIVCYCVELEELLLEVELVVVVSSEVVSTKGTSSVTVACTSSKGAPKSTAPVAKASVCFS